MLETLNNARTWQKPILVLSWLGAAYGLKYLITHI